MSTKCGKIGRHKFHGDPGRFEVLAEYIAQNYTGRVKKLADVAGGQGMLARILAKKYNFEVDVIDPKGFTLVGVQTGKMKYLADMAKYYDLIIGLHPDQALPEIAKSALERPVVVIPCCNFWSTEKTLGRDALLWEIEKYYNQYNITHKRVTFSFEGPKNIGIVSEPPKFLNL